MELIALGTLLVVIVVAFIIFIHNPLKKCYNCGSRNLMYSWHDFFKKIHVTCKDCGQDCYVTPRNKKEKEQHS